MTCIRCNLDDYIANVSAKCSDMCYFGFKNHEQVGYVPDDIGIGSGDYISFSYCLHCGQIQGKFPKTFYKDDEGEE